MFKRMTNQQFAHPW